MSLSRFFPDFLSFLLGVTDCCCPWLCPPMSEKELLFLGCYVSVMIVLDRHKLKDFFYLKSPFSLLVLVEVWYDFRLSSVSGESLAL